MAQTASTELKAHLAGESLTVAYAMKVTRSDGTTEGYTDHETAATISAVTYSPLGGYTATATEHTSDLSVDNLELEFFIKAGYITKADLVEGVYDNAEYWIFLYNYDDLTQGTMAIQRGNFGEVTIYNGRFVVELRSLTQKLQQTVGREHLPSCDVELGSTKCGINLTVDTAWAADTVYTADDYVSAVAFDGRRYICTTGGTSGSSEPTWDTVVGNPTTEGPDTLEWECEDHDFLVAGEVTGVTSNAIFVDSSLTQADDYFTYGLLTWLTGNNAGRSMEVRDYVLSTTTVTLFQAMVEAVQVGDTYKVTAGCDKDKSTCINTFSNLINFRGFPYIPGEDAFNRTGDKY